MRVWIWLLERSSLARLVSPAKTTTWMTWSWLWLRSSSTRPVLQSELRAELVRVFTLL